MEQQICLLLELLRLRPISDDINWKKDLKNIHTAERVKCEEKKVGYNDKYPSREREKEVVLLGSSSVSFLPSCVCTKVYVSSSAHAHTHTHTHNLCLKLHSQIFK